MRGSVAVAAALALASCAPSAPRFAFTHSEQRGRIKSNGLKFVVMPDPSTQLVEVDVRYDVGSREDPPGKAGLAHLVEHLMFQARPDGPDTEPLFHAIIELATDFNAYTNWDTTHYRMTSRAENLEAMLKIETMRMFYGCQTIPEAEFEREREVVRNEIRAQSSADDYIIHLVEAAIYPPNHPYARMVGGNDQQIATATLQDACEFMRKYYAPERATVLIAGGVDVASADALVTKWFGRVPGRPAAPRVPVPTFTPDHAQREIDADVERPAVWVGWALPPDNTPAGDAARFGIASAFVQIAQAGEKYEFATRVEPRFLGGKLAPAFVVRIELPSLDKVDEAIEFARKAAAQADRGADLQTATELDEDKNREKARFITDLEKLSDRTEEVADLVQFEHGVDFDSSELYVFHALDKIAKFDPATIATAVKQTLDWNRAVVVVVKPNKAGLAGDTRAAVRYDAAAKTDAKLTDAAVDPRQAAHPLPVPPLAGGVAGAQRFTLGNGMAVVLLPVHAMPVVAAELLFKQAGAAATPDEPLVGRTAAEFLQPPRDADAFRATGIELGCSATADAAFCRAYGVSIYLDVLLKGLERTITVGEYDQTQIEAWQKERKSRLALHHEQERTEYARQVLGALYGPDHPYTRAAVITPAAVDQVHRDALDRFRKDHYTAGNATLVVVGDFDPAIATATIRNTFGGWHGGAIPTPALPARAPAGRPTFIGVTTAKPEQQVTLTIAYPAPPGVDGREPARRMLATMLSYRAADVRFKLGSTYGLGFSREPHFGPSAYMLRGGAAVGGTVDAERAGESLAALRAGLVALRAGDHFDEDFVRARRALMASLLSESTVTRELAQRLGFIAEHGLAADYDAQLLKHIALISPAQIRALIADELDPSHEVVVVLGDAAHVAATFAGAHIADPTIVTPAYH